MKPQKLLFILFILLSFNVKIKAQDAFLISGNPDFLKEQDSLNVEFVYKDMKVGEFTEEIYLKQKKTTFRKPADFDKFSAKWSADFKNMFEPKFMEKLNNGIVRIALKGYQDIQKPRYTMIVKTTHLEPGFYGGSNSNKRDTYVDLLVTFIETAKPDKILCTVKAENIVGVTEIPSDMKETDLRITSAYTLAADRIAHLISKICSKRVKLKEDKITIEEDELDKDKTDKNDDGTDKTTTDSKDKKDKKEKKEKKIKKSKDIEEDPNE